MDRDKRGAKGVVSGEEGSILLIALLIMMLLTIVGLSAMNSTTTDLKVSRNDSCFKQNTFRAEAAAFEAGELMEGVADPRTSLKPVTTSFSWLGDGGGFNPENGVWDYAGAAANAARSAVYAADGTSGYTVVFEGLPRGASFDASKPQLWNYTVYGRSEACGGRVDVVMGYRRRF